MFEPNTPPTSTPPQNPLNPVMPAPGMTNMQTPPSTPAAPLTPAQPQVHTMPERFRTGGSPAGGPKGSSTTKKLIITLVVVVVVAGLGVAGLFIFNKVVKTNANTANTNLLTNTANRNANTNTSLNTNTVTNTTLNTNTTNANTSANVNEASNTNTVANSNTNATANTNTTSNTNTSVTTGPLPSSLDTDSDGLTDVEEVVYGTDPKNADTDGDTFIDGKKVQADGSVIGELVNLYNPKGAAKLEESNLVKRVENSAKAFSLLVPTSWTTNESASILVITPTTQTNEFFQVRTYDNASRQTPQQWYVSTNPQAQVGLLKSAAINGLETLTSEDGMTVYFFKDAKVYGVNYTATGLTQLNYWTTLDVLTRSFKLVASS